MRKKIEYVEGYRIPESSFMPFGGLLKDTIYNQVLAEVVADPYRTYTPGEMQEILKLDRSKVGKALSDLEQLGLLRNISHQKRRPLYEPRLDSNRLQALTFLAYAVVDDRDGEVSMAISISSYYRNGIAICDPSSEVSGGEAEPKHKAPEPMLKGVGST